jgi:hypothetical protein
MVTKIKKKSLISEVSTAANDVKDIDLINKHTIVPLTEDDVFTFKIRLCDNEIDRVFDGMTDKFLEEFKERGSNLTGISNHDWSSNNQVSRLYDTEIITDETRTNKIGEPYKYVLGKAYTLKRFEEYIEKISAGLLKETSVSFESSGDTCSICGAETVKGEDNIAICPNGHIMGQMYDGKLAYNVVDNLTDIFEWSLVAVPCQRDSGVVSKSLNKDSDENSVTASNKDVVDKDSNRLGGLGIMKKKNFILSRLFKSKAFEADENKELADEVMKVTDSDEDVTEDDINKLIDENAKLINENEELKAKVKALEDEKVCGEKQAIVEKAIDELNPLTPVVKENILKEIDVDSLDLVDGELKGFDEAFEPVVKKYKGLFIEKKDTNEGGGEPAVVKTSAKAVNKSGITFSVTNKSVAPVKNKVQGITIK